MIGNLTQREVDVCRELVKGKTDREIALAINAARNTVKRHMCNIALKMGCPRSKILIASYLMHAAQQYPLIAEALEL